jgi:hypothetical protein
MTTRWLMLAVAFAALVFSMAVRKPTPLTVSGRVLDRATRAPIPRFRVILGSQSGHGVIWQPHRMVDCERGRFSLRPDERAWEQTWYRVEAEGYAPSVSRGVRKSEGVVLLKFALVANPGPSAIILSPDGLPAAGAQATWATVSFDAVVRGAAITLCADERHGARVSTADNRGQVRLAPECDEGLVVVAHAAGYAELKPTALSARRGVQLRPWCRAQGQLLAGSKPVSGQTIWIHRSGYVGHQPVCEWEARAITDADGRFACDRVVAGRLIVDRVFTQEDAEHAAEGLSRTIEVREGEVAHVCLGGPGRALAGRFEAPRLLPQPIDWSLAHARLTLKAPHIGFPGDDAASRVYGAFLDSEEGKAYCRDPLPVDPDGSFRVEGVPPGRYQLSIRVTGPAVGRPDEAAAVYARSGTEIEVKPAPPAAAQEPLSLPPIVLK